MKTFASLVLLGLFSAALMGCEASARVGDEDNDVETSRKTTTTIEPDGDRTTKTEVKVDR